VADLDAEAARIEKFLVHFGDPIDDASEAECVIRPIPSLSGQLKASRDCAVDVCEIERFDTAVGGAGPHEHTKIGSHFLLSIHANAAASTILSDRGNVRRHAGGFRQLDSILKGPHATPAQKAGDRDLARM